MFSNIPVSWLVPEVSDTFRFLLCRCLWNLVSVLMDGFEIFVVSVDRQKLVVRRPVGRLLIVHDTKTSGIIEQNKNLNEGAEPVLVAIIGKRLRHPPPSPPLFLGSRSSQSENTGLRSEDCVFKVI